MQGDRILIFEDTDGDGKFDKRTVFMEGLNLVSGLEVGFGGVWIGAAPYFMFVPMRPGEDKPAGPPQILLDGFGLQDTHETLNTFTWGPDGWLYGCHGVFTHSRVGKPGTPDAERTPMNAAVWRYHPTRHVFELFAEGTSNPWGLDFNDRGQAFVEACVIPHLFHIIQGGRYQRQAGGHFNPYTYEDIRTIADHVHYVGGNPHGGNNKSDAAGGGHAHCGLMVYLGGAWPAEYRDQLFMGNLHGHRLNVDTAKPKGSGYVAGHSPDFLLANDAWARFINFTYGPDGNVYVIDWYDKQACHVGANINAWDRSNGRVYKVCYRGTKWEPVDLAKKSDAELVELQLHANDWYVRHARRLMQERGGNPAVHEAMRKILTKHPDEPRRLRAMWALHVTGGLRDEDVGNSCLDMPMPYVRGWAMQLALESKAPSAAFLAKLAVLAEKDASPVVRLYIASALQRMDLELRPSILKGLLTHGEDADDHNLPLMYWYAAEPLAAKDPKGAYELAAASPIAKIGAFMSRRIGSLGTIDALELLAGRLSGTAKDRVILGELKEALKGRRQVPMPKSWGKAFDVLMKNPDSALREQALSLAVVFGDARALDRLRELVESATTNIDVRKNSLETLVAARDPKLPPTLLALLDVDSMRGPALRALATFDDPKTPAAILGLYPKLPPAERRDALNTLTSRSAYAKALLEAVAAKSMPASDISADLVRQLRNLGDKDLERRLNEVWGYTRPTPADRAQADRRAQGVAERAARAGPGVGSGRFREGLSAVPQAVRRRRQGRARHHRLEPRQSRLSSREHHRSERCHPEGIRRPRADAVERPDRHRHRQERDRRRRHRADGERGPHPLEGRRRYAHRQHHVDDAGRSAQAAVAGRGEASSAISAIRRRRRSWRRRTTPRTSSTASRWRCGTTTRNSGASSMASSSARAPASRTTASCAPR